MTAKLMRDTLDPVDEEVIVVHGIVEHGDERGRQLGFPTANIRGIDNVRRDGVYAGTVQVDPAGDGPTYVSAVSVGHRPTYYGKDGLRLLEANLLDFTGDLYDHEVRIELHVRLRPQHKYVDTPTLVRQLHLDVEATRAWALSNGLQHLLADEPTGPDRPDRSRARRRVTRAAAGDHRAKARARAARRTELIAQAVLDAQPHQLTHQWVALCTGIPVGYLTWRFPTVDDLTALAR